MSDMARIFDPETGKISTIPIAELAPGMVEMDLVDIGCVWVQRAKLKTVKGNYLHPPLDAKARQLIKEQIMEPLSEVLPMTLEQWEDGFRRDIIAEREMAVWTILATRYTAFIKANLLNKPQKKETLHLMLHCTEVPNEEAFWATFQPQFLTKQQVESAIAPFQKNWRTDVSTPSLTDSIIIQHPVIAARCAWLEKLVVLWPSLEALYPTGQERVETLIIDVQNQEQLDLLSHRVRRLKQFFSGAPGGDLPGND